MPTHLYGGLASACFPDARIANLRAVDGPIDALPRLALAFSIIAVAAIVWELLGYPSDLTLGSHLNLGVADTRSDLCFGLPGAACFAAVRFARGAPQTAAADV